MAEKAMPVPGGWQLIKRINFDFKNMQPMYKTVNWKTWPARARYPVEE
jgi:hypothetical protein